VTGWRVVKAALNEQASKTVGHLAWHWVIGSALPTRFPPVSFAALRVCFREYACYSPRRTDRSCWHLPLNGRKRIFHGWSMGAI
jgi:hypothetical protein